MALASLNKHTEAVSYYKKALELDPENDTYKSNLKIAEQKMKETPSPVSSCVKSAVSVNTNHTLIRVFTSPLTVPGYHLQTGGMGGVDLAGLLSNPGFMNMVSWTS